MLFCVCENPASQAIPPDSRGWNILRRQISTISLAIPVHQVIDDAGGTCPVCLDVFTEKAPLVFACGHTVCAECVFGIALRCKDGTAICPECRVPTRLDGALRVNVALQETLGDIVAVKQVCSPCALMLQIHGKSNAFDDIRIASCVIGIVSHVSPSILVFCPHHY